MSKVKRTDFLKSRIVNGVSEKDLRSGNFNTFIFKARPKPFLVIDKYAYRPDLISYDMYGTDSYWWMVMKFNGICDPFTELTSGVVLQIPSIEDLKRYIASEVK